MREALSLREGLNRLCAMGGVKSLNRNLKNEDEAVARNIEACEKTILGANYDTKPSSAGSEDEMELMAARDIVVNLGQKAEAAPPAPAPVTPTPAPAPVAPPAVTPAAPAEPSLATTPTWIKAVLLASGLGGMFGGGAKVNQWINSTPVQPPAVTKPITYDVGGKVTPLEIEK